jgi:GNAT superfamily N-acetyltransferase
MTARGPDIGLAVVRMGNGPSTLVTVTRDHVLLRTPSRPDFWDGNLIQVLSQPDDLRPWVKRFEASIGALPGVQRIRILWPADELDGPAPDGVEELNLVLNPMRLSVLDTLADIAPADIELVTATTDAHWHAHSVLARHDVPEVPHEFWAWRSGEVRAICEHGHGTVWLARKAGLPVGRVTLLCDGMGLAAVDDVVTHPVYRRAGVATTLVHHAIRVHLAEHAEDAVVLLADPFSAAERLYGRLGFVPGPAIVQADRPR